MLKLKKQVNFSKNLSKLRKFEGIAPQNREMPRETAHETRKFRRVHKNFTGKIEKPLRGRLRSPEKYAKIERA
ncbi:MAG: hypothetical protein LUC50_08010 [Ruminococcus sp.]|nr:hypothetical protein [Ruminococcus sp.]